MTTEEYLEAMNKIAVHLKEAVIELVAAKSLSTALMAELKAEREAKGYKTGGSWWALTSCFETAATKSLAIIEEKVRNVRKRLYPKDDNSKGG